MNPRIVYASITAFGQHGPYADAARLRHAGAGDQRLHEHHRLSRQPAHAVGPVDLRLLRRHAVRLQHRVRAALPRPHAARGSASTWRCSTAWSSRSTTSASATRSAASSSRARATSRSAARAPASTRRRDGHVAIAAGASDAVWRRFCEIIGRADLTPRSRLRHRGGAARSPRRDRRHHPGLDEPRAPRPRWCGILATGGVPAAPVNNVAEMVADPQVQAREMFVELDHPIYGPLKMTGTPLKLSETPGRVRWLAPHARASTTRRSSSGCSATRATTSRAGRPRAWSDAVVSSATVAARPGALDSRGPGGR